MELLAGEKKEMLYQVCLDAKGKLLTCRCISKGSVAASPVSVRQVVETAKKVTGVDFTVEERPRRAGDPAVLVASSERIRRELGWQPKKSDLETIVQDAWAWHKGHPRGFA